MLRRGDVSCCDLSTEQASELRNRPPYNRRRKRRARISARQTERDAADTRSVKSTLVELRERAGVSQQALAERLDVAKSAVARFESDSGRSPQLATLRRYARALGYRVRIEFEPDEPKA